MILWIHPPADLLGSNDTIVTETDLLEIEYWFRRYARSFATADLSVKPVLRLKEDHCVRVAHGMRKLAAALKLDGEEVHAAALSGLLHDVGRFEQYTRYGTFVDAKSVNHAELGVQVLMSAKLLDRFTRPVRERILDAVRFHNRAAVPEGLSEEGSRLACMVRDADKLDIWHIVTAYYESPDKTRINAIDLDLSDSDRISPEVAHAAESGALCDVKELRSINDFKVLQMTWIYDVNYTPAFREIAQRRFMERIRDALPRTALVARICRSVRRHLDDGLRR
jgi:putative nucleotidyltransferase with HDIG domain